jgi:hypothetical protein
VPRRRKQNSRHLARTRDVPQKKQRKTFGRADALLPTQFFRVSCLRGKAQRAALMGLYDKGRKTFTAHLSGLDFSRTSKRVVSIELYPSRIPTIGDENSLYNPN